MVQPVNRAFGLAEVLSDLAWRKPAHVAHEHDAPLIARESLQCREQRLQTLGIPFVRRGLRGGRLAPARPSPAPHLVHCKIARHPPDPCGEGDFPRFVLLNRPEELGENGLGYVFGFVVVVDDAADIALDCGGVAYVQVANGLAVTGFRAVDRSFQPQSV